MTNRHGARRARRAYVSLQPARTKRLHVRPQRVATDHTSIVKLGSWRFFGDFSGLALIAEVRRGLKRRRGSAPPWFQVSHSWYGPASALLTLRGRMTRQIGGDAEPNTGSRARDHLANERTYLAWLRTGVSVAALGVAVAKFAPQRGIYAVVSGGILIFAGLLLSAWGTLRYRAVGRQLDAGVFASASFGAIAAATVVTLLSLIAVLVLI